MRRLFGALTVLAAAIVLGLAARTWLVSTVRIAGSSMQDTLASGDVALVTRFDRTFERGDVVECRFSGRDGTYVKRIAGLPGDVLEFAGGTLTVNGTPVSEPYVSSSAGDLRAEVGPDEYFVLGDNRAESYDSRAADMGGVARTDLLGRVRWILWPLNRFGPVE